MKKIKKLALNKEIVHFLGGNDMNLIKGGTNTGYTVNCPATYTPNCLPGGGSAPVDNTYVAPPQTNTCQASVCFDCTPPPPPPPPVLQPPTPQSPTDNTCVNASCFGTCGAESCFIDDCWQHAEY